MIGYESGSSDGEQWTSWNPSGDIAVLSAGVQGSNEVAMDDSWGPSTAELTAFDHYDPSYSVASSEYSTFYDDSFQPFLTRQDYTPNPTSLYSFAPSETDIFSPPINQTFGSTAAPHLQGLDLELAMGPMDQEYWRGILSQAELDGGALEMGVTLNLGGICA